MNSQAVPLALSGAVCVGALVYAASKPWRRLDPRVDAYTVAARRRMGEDTQILQLLAPPPTATGVASAVFGPIIAAGVRKVAALLGHRSEDEVALALDRAGISGVTAREYMYQQFTFAGVGLLGGIVVGLVGGVAFSLFLGMCGLFIGAMWKRSELDRRTRHRQERMQSELVNICYVLASHARATPNLQSVVAAVCQRGQGEIVGELRRVLAAIESGTAPESAFQVAAHRTPEPAAANLYRALALAITSGGDLADTLLAQAAGLRDRYRDVRKDRATKRTQFIYASNASLMVIPLLVLIAAAIPYMVLSKL